MKIEKALTKKKKVAHYLVWFKLSAKGFEFFKTSGVFSTLWNVSKLLICINNTNDVDLNTVNMSDVGQNVRRRLHISNTRNKFHVNNKETMKKLEDGYPMSWNQHSAIL